MDFGQVKFLKCEFSFPNKKSDLGIGKMEFWSKFHQNNWLVHFTKINMNHIIFQDNSNEIMDIPSEEY